MNMKEAKLKAEIKEDENGVVVIFKYTEPLKGESEIYMTVEMTPDRLTAELVKDGPVYFAFQEFQYTKMDAEIAC